MPHSPPDPEELINSDRSAMRHCFILLSRCLAGALLTPIVTGELSSAECRKHAIHNLADGVISAVNHIPELNSWYLKITSPQSHKSRAKDCNKLFCSQTKSELYS